MMQVSMEAYQLQQINVLLKTIKDLLAIILIEISFIALWTTLRKR